MLKRRGTCSGSVRLRWKCGEGLRWGWICRWGNTAGGASWGSVGGFTGWEGAFHCSRGVEEGGDWVGIARGVSSYIGGPSVGESAAVLACHPVQFQQVPRLCNGVVHKLV